jgi:hypothetical protein
MFNTENLNSTQPGLTTPDVMHSPQNTVLTTGVPTANSPRTTQDVQQYPIKTNTKHKR